MCLWPVFFETPTFTTNDQLSNNKRSADFRVVRSSCNFSEIFIIFNNYNNTDKTFAIKDGVATIRTHLDCHLDEPNACMYAMLLWATLSNQGRWTQWTPESRIFFDWARQWTWSRSRRVGEALISRLQLKTWRPSSYKP